MDNQKHPPPYDQQPGWNIPMASAPAAPLITAPPQPAAPAAPVVLHTNTYVYADSGRGLTCPQCNARVIMTVKRHSTCKTHMCAVLLCLFLCWPCVCLPCCCEWCYETSQFCPNCNACLGIS